MNRLVLLKLWELLCCAVYSAQPVYASAVSWSPWSCSTVWTGVAWLVAIPQIFTGSLLQLDWAFVVLLEWCCRPTLQDVPPLLLGQPCSWSASWSLPPTQWTHLILGILVLSIVSWTYSTLQTLRIQLMQTLSWSVNIHTRMLCLENADFNVFTMWAANWLFSTLTRGQLLK